MTRPAGYSSIKILKKRTWGIRNVMVERQNTVEDRIPDLRRRRIVEVGIGSQRTRAGCPHVSSRVAGPGGEQGV